MFTPQIERMLPHPVSSSRQAASETGVSHMPDPTILRRWASRIRTEDRAAYADYVGRTGVSDYGATEGNLGFQMLLRDLGDSTTEVVTLSWWTSIEAIKAFAGDDHERARYYTEDDRYLLEKPDKVQHSDVVIEG